MGIIGKIIPLVAIGAALAFAANIFTRPQDALASAGALGETGAALGSSLSRIGLGASDLGGGIGSGLSGLLQPAWEIRNLFTAFSSNVAGAANSSAVAQSEGETVRNVNNPSSSTITWSGGTTRSVPTLSAAAKSFYAARGVSVT